MFQAHAIPNRVIFASLLMILFASLYYFNREGLSDAWVQLNENQIMYLYSTSAQVIAAIYGLTIAGYIFFRGELNREAKDDPTLAEPIEKLEARYFHQLAFITALVMATICAASLVIAYEIDKDVFLLTVLMNSGQCLFGVSFLAIFFFIIDIVQPGNIKSASKTLQKKIDPLSDNTQHGNLGNFISNYLKIEKVLSAGFRLLEETTGREYTDKNKRTPNTQIVEILGRSGIITNELAQKTKTLISLRHAIMHGGEQMVSQGMVDQSTKVLYELEGAIESARFQK